ncbi:MAG: hypothetical protein ABR567_13445 [Myxococcales bacterium]|nr:hypothetical protein [Myxococcales bacterium]
MTKITLATVLLAAPLAARADIGLRVGGEASIAYHNDAGTHVVTDNWPVGLDLMLSYWLPTSLISIDAELGEQWLLKDPSMRIGTVFRPGIRVSPPVLPIYLRGAIPINVETNTPACPAGAICSGRETFDLRLGAGITIPLVLFKIYIEGDADFPLGGGTNAPSAFSNWNLVLNGGLDFRF